MSYYPDLSPYHYLPSTVPEGVVALNVGWLSWRRPYPKGKSPGSFVEALERLCKNNTTAKTRGLHSCRLFRGFKPSCGKVSLETDTGPITLGSSEIRVVTGKGEWLISPDLVFHYVTRHDYLPPEEFMKAVMELRLAPDSP
ncbi:hypothetical protein [Streptomyces alkaliphilus]|uniref:DUF7919 family protein n=1 Tax=Streptomyces alkaliphilus TaxID=1472722 RepID=UPI00117CED31|nr:hypothetical protein [Streptomyces alkaliphilus]MQS09804.1 hypothetical protein [Streptomyces alkaliphilus]